MMNTDISTEIFLLLLLRKMSKDGIDFDPTTGRVFN